jgi:hypothetical protein
MGTIHQITIFMSLCFIALGISSHVDVSHVDVSHIDVSHVDVSHIDVSHVDVSHIDVSHIDVSHIGASNQRELCHLFTAYILDDLFSESPLLQLKKEGFQAGCDLNILNPYWLENIHWFPYAIIDYDYDDNCMLNYTSFKKVQNNIL